MDSVSLCLPSLTNGRIGVNPSTNIFCTIKILTQLKSTVNAAHSLRPSRVSPGNTSYDPATTVHLIQYDNSKEQKLFGLKYRNKLETTRDIIEDFEARGWVN